MGSLHMPGMCAAYALSQKQTKNEMNLSGCTKPCNEFHNMRVLGGARQ